MRSVHYEMFFGRLDGDKIAVEGNSSQLFYISLT